MKVRKLLLLGLMLPLFFSCGGGSDTDESGMWFNGIKASEVKSGTDTSGDEKVSDVWSDDAVDHYCVMVSMAQTTGSAYTFDLSKIQLSTGGNTYSVQHSFRLTKNYTLSDEKVDIDDGYKNVKTYTLTYEDEFNLSVESGRSNSIARYLEFGLDSLPTDFTLTYDGKTMAKYSEDHLRETDDYYQLEGLTGVFCYNEDKFVNRKTGVETITYRTVNESDVTSIKTVYCEISLSDVSSLTLNASDITLDVNGSKKAATRFVSYNTSSSTTASGLYQTVYTLKESKSVTVASGNIQGVDIDFSLDSIPSTLSLYYKGKAVRLIGHTY